jgi:cysteinyl-tRNA synthetase
LFGAADLRIFFLQHKYSSTLHFSRDRIDEASKFRQKIQQFYHLINTTVQLSQHAAFNKKPNRESQDLLRSLFTCRSEILDALADDFDTPRALNSVAGLISKAIKYNSLIMAALNVTTFFLDISYIVLSFLLTCSFLELFYIAIFGAID